MKPPTWPRLHGESLRSHDAPPQADATVCGGGQFIHPSLLPVTHIENGAHCSAEVLRLVKVKAGRTNEVLSCCRDYTGSQSPPCGDRGKDLPIHTSPKQPWPSLTSSRSDSRGISQASLARP